MRERVDTPSPKWRLRVESCRRARKQSGVKKTGPASWIRTPMPRNKPGSRKKVRALFLQQPLCVCVRGRGKHRDVASPHTRVFRHHHERTNPVATNITPHSLAHKHAIPTPLFPPPPRPQQLANGSSSTASATAPRASSDTWNPRRRRCRRRYVKRGPSSFPPRSIDATAVSSLRRHYTSRRSRMNTSSLSRVLPFTTGISPHHTRILPFREPNSL